MELNKKLETQLVLYNTLTDYQILLFENEKLRQDMDQYKRERDQYKAENERLKQENKDLRLQGDTYFNEWQESKLKAQAFDRIDEVYGDSDLYSDECVLETIQEEIDRLEQK